MLINKIEDVELFSKRIGFSISRKNKKPDDALVIIKAHCWKTRAAAWKELYVKERGEWVRQTSCTPT